MVAGINRVPQRVAERQPRCKEIIGQQDNRVKCLDKPSFDQSKENGGVILQGESDSVVAQVQDARYGTSFTPGSAGGDFASKIVIGVGFLNDQKAHDAEIDLSDPNLRYGAGITIYQKTDVGRKHVFMGDVEAAKKELQEINANKIEITGEAKNKRINELQQIISNEQNTKEIRETRTASSRTEPTAISLVDITADAVHIKARSAGVNIYGGYDNKIPNYGGVKEAANLSGGGSAAGVNLIGGGNPSTDVLNKAGDVRGLQPIPKGDNLVKVLERMNKNISDVSNRLRNLARNQEAMEKILFLHSHPVAGIGVAVAGPSIELGVAGIAKTVSSTFELLLTITDKYNQIATNVNMSEISTGGVLSKFNRTN